MRQDGSGEFTEIQAAIDASFSGDVIQVGPGVYRESLVFGGRRIELRSTDGPKMTILDGSEEPVSILRLTFAEARTARIVGFTMQAGRGTPLTEPEPNAPERRQVETEDEGGLRYGGAVLCNPGSATFENVHFVGNSTNRGGAVYCGSNSSPLFIDCVFRGNQAGEGGALASFYARPILDRAVFVGNQAVYGGAVYDAEGDIVCRTSRFEGNVASEGGAAFVRDGRGRGRFESCVFWKNRGAEGAAVRVTTSDVDIVSSVLADNEFPEFSPSQVHYSNATGSLERNVFYAGRELVGLSPLLCDQNGSATVECNLFWPGLPTETCGRVDQNFATNPLFCRPGNGNFEPRPDSPCLAENAPGDCGAIGPYSEAGCGVPVRDLESLGAGPDVQSLETRKQEPPPPLGSENPP